MAEIGNNTRIESTAIIEEDVQIGDNCYIGHNTIIRPKTIIGDNSEIRAFCFVAGNVKIGNYVRIFQYSNIAYGSIINNSIYIGTRVVLVNTRRISWRREYPPKLKGPYIKSGARIASGSILMPGVTIGKNALVGAGSLVDRDVPDRQIWFGSPARKRGTVPDDEICMDHI